MYASINHRCCYGLDRQFRLSVYQKGMKVVQKQWITKTAPACGAADRLAGDP